MRARQRWLIGGAALLLGTAALLWWLPARWALPLVEPRLHGMQLQQVQGRLWDGRAEQLIAANGRALGTLRWKLSRRALLGEVRLRVDLDSPTLRFGGDVRQLIGERQEWRNVALWVDLARHRPALSSPFGAPQGTFELTVPYAVLQANWPLQLAAWARWRDAAVRTGGAPIALGSLRFLAQGEDGVIRMQMYDEGNGPLALNGQLELNPLGWGLDARLQPRNGDPTLRHWLATLGHPDADGAVQLQRHGGLATALPSHGPQP